MIKNAHQVPSISMKFEHEALPTATSVQVMTDGQAVTVAYLNPLGNAIDVREFRVKDDPELRDIVEMTFFDDVWDIDMVLALVDRVDPDETVELMPLIPAYLESIGVAS